MLVYLTFIDVNTVSLFKARLGKFWMYRDSMYDIRAELTEIGR